MSPHASTPAAELIEAVVEKHTDDLVELRRDLHAHPELSWAEHRTTEIAAIKSCAGNSKDTHEDDRPR